MNLNDGFCSYLNKQHHDTLQFEKLDRNKICYKPKSYIFSDEKFHRKAESFC